MSNVTEVLSKKVYALDQALVLFCLMLQRELIFIKVADLNIYNMYIYICMYIYIYIYNKESTTRNTGKPLLCPLQLVNTQIKGTNITYKS